MAGRLAIQANLDHRAVEDQPDDVIAAEITPLPGFPGRAGLLPGAADDILADAALEQLGERAARPAGVHPGEVDLGDQRLSAVAEPLVRRQQRALPLLLARLVGQPRTRHRQAQRAERRDQLARPVAVTTAVRARAPLIASAAERGVQLLLQQLLDERAHMPAHGLLQRVEPIAAGERRWRHRQGWRSFLHGVGSFSILPIGTYATSTNFHQPRDTTSAARRRLLQAQRKPTPLDLPLAR